MAGGPTMNLLLAFVILLGVTATYGVYRTQLTVNRVQECIVAVGEPTNDCAGKPKTPAYASGIQDRRHHRRLQRSAGDRLGRRCHS